MRTAVLLLLLALPPLAHADGLDDVVITSVPLGDSTWMLQGRGGNILLVAGSTESLLVDDQFAPLSQRIEAAVGALTKAPVGWVVNTHWHGDHTGGNEHFGAAGARIVAHEAVRARLSTAQTVEFFGMEKPAAPKTARPVVTFAESVTLYVNDRAVEVIHVDPAHTDGDSIVRVADVDVLHLGDTFFHGNYPFIDAGTGGGIDGMAKAGRRSLELAGATTKIVPGHGPLATKEDLETYVTMLEGVRDAIRPLVDAGTSKEDIVAAKPTAPFDGAWGGGFIGPDAFVGIVVDGMRAKR
jgi:cyclase